MSSRRAELSLPPDEAWKRLQEAFASIGKVEEANDTSKFLVGKARYGLNPVRLRISVLSGGAPDTSVLDIQGRGQDIMGGASRKVIDRLLAAL